MRRIYWLWCFVASIGQAQTPALPTIPANTFYITNFGAVADGVTTNTAAIQSAINAANAVGGGIVRVTAGNFLSGPIAFVNNLNLQFDANATLTMLPLNQYPGGDVAPANFIAGTGLHDVAITGPGVIEGQGLAWWKDSETNAAAVRPNMVNFSTSTRVLIQDITCSNSPSPFLVFKGKAGNITIQRVKIYAPSSGAAVNPSHNTDAIDLAETNAVIRDCIISTGDDNLAVGSSASASYGILVTNCAFGDGHGCSIGSFTSGTVSNLTVINCTFNGTDNGIRLKSQRGRGGVVQNCNYYNLTMTNVDWPLLIYSYYEYGLGTLTSINPQAADNIAVTNGSALNSTTPIWRNITFSNITATVPAGRPPLMVWGLPEAPAANINFRSVTITSSSTLVPGIYGATNLQFIDCSFNLPASVNTLQFYNAQLTITNSTSATNLLKLDGLTTNGVVNSLTLYNARAALAKTNAIETAPLTLAGSLLNITNHFKISHATPLNFVLGTDAATINVRSNLLFDGTWSFTAGAGFTNGSYTIATYGSTLTWAAPTNASAPAGYLYAFNTNTPGQIKLDATLLNTAPIFAALSNRTVIAGNNINFTCSAADTPTQTITFTLQNGPTNATLDGSSGTFNWRPTMAQSDTTNFINIIASDNGSPSLSATQSFTITVWRPPQPTLAQLSATGNSINLTVNGVAGPDYTVQTSTNLVNWSNLVTTTPPALPFIWVDPNPASVNQRFYRILLGP